MKFLIFSTISLSMGSLSFAERKPEIRLEMHLTMFGKTICESTLISEDGRTYLWCEGDYDKNRIQSKFDLEVRNDGSIVVKANVDQISPSGEVLNLSNPIIATLYDETATASQLDSAGQVLQSLSITPRIK
jgi:hypothetical protein